MENKENMYDKTPFYMTYPMQNLYLAEMEYEKDMERMRELYPREVQQLLRLVEQRCDELEMEGSRLYDENPDRFMLDQEICRLYEAFLRENPQYESMRPERPMPMPMPEQGRPMPEQGRPMPMPEQGRPMQPDMQRPRRYSILPPEEFRDIMMEGPSQSDMQMPEYGVREDITAQNRRSCDNPWLCNLIDVLFKDEMYRRRCRHRRCRRWNM